MQGKRTDEFGVARESLTWLRQLRTGALGFGLGVIVTAAALAIGASAQQSTPETTADEPEALRKVPIPAQVSQADRWRALKGDLNNDPALVLAIDSSGDVQGWFGPDGQRDARRWPRTVKDVIGNVVTVENPKY